MTVKCKNCRHLNLLAKNNPCTKNHNLFVDSHDLAAIAEVSDMEHDCPDFKSKYIEYPITVAKINLPSTDSIDTIQSNDNSGKFVRIRTCKENETYLGIYLGEAAIQPIINYNENTQELTLKSLHNPAIFVPALKRTVYGCESWWDFIDNPEDLSEITDETINNQWYVQALKTLASKED